MAAKIFWYLATMDVVLCVGFLLRSRIAAGQDPKADRVALVQSQRQDTWLACAVIWAVILSDGHPIQDLLCLAGTAVLVWLLGRTLQRLRML